MTNEYLTLNQAIALLGCEEPTLKNYIACEQLRPCFLCNVVLMDFLVTHEDFGTDDEGHAGYINLLAYISPSERTKFAPLLDVQADKIFYLSRAKVVATVPPESNWFVDEDGEQVSEVETYRAYQIHSNSPAYKAGYGLELHTKDCVFLKSELEKLLPEQLIESTSEHPITESKILDWDKLIQRSDSIRDVMIEILKDNIKISGNVMWTTLYKMAENSEEPFHEVRVGNGDDDGDKLIYHSKSQAEAGTQTINKRSIERRLRELKKTFKSIAAR